MMIIGLYFIVGGLTGAYFFNWNVKRWNDRTSAVIRDAFIILFIIGLVLIVTDCIVHALNTCT